MKRTLFELIVGCSVFVFTSSNVWAQATAQISGTAKDRTGAVLPGVEITATQTETAATRTAVTNETGSYVLSNLPTEPPVVQERDVLGPRHADHDAETVACGFIEQRLGRRDVGADGIDPGPSHHREVGGQLRGRRKL